MLKGGEAQWSLSRGEQDEGKLKEMSWHWRACLRLEIPLQCKVWLSEIDQGDCIDYGMVWGIYENLFVHNY